MIIVFALLLIAGAFGTKKVFGYSIEESLFFNILLTVILLLISGIIGLLGVGFYLTVFIFLVMFVYGIYLTAKNKDFDLYEILTPGLCGFILSCFIYFINVRNLGFHYWDEPMHWGVAVKHMWLTNKIYPSIQSLGVPLFSYFFVKISGYSEGLVFLSRWIFIWSAFVLLLKNIKWNKWYIALIAWIIFSCIGNLIVEEPIYYMDTPLGVLMGVLLAYNALSKKDGLKTNIILYMGLAVLVNVKDGLGLEAALLAWLFLCVYELTFIKGGLKKKLIKLSVLLTSIPFGYILLKIAKVKLENYFTAKRMPNIEGIVSSLMTPGFLLSIAAMICFFLIFVFARKIKKIKSGKYYNLLKYFSLVSSVVLLLMAVKKIIYAIYLNLDSGTEIYFLNSLKNMWRESYYSHPVFLLILFLMGFSFLLSVLSVKKEERLRYISGNLALVLMIIIHGVVLSFLYAVAFEEWESSTLICFNRYMGYIIIAASIFVTTQSFLNDKLYNDFRINYLAAGAVFIVFSHAFPIPFELDFKRNDSAYISYEHGLKEYSKKAASDIIKIVPEDGSIFMICQNNGAQWSDSGVCHWIHYYIAPRTKNYVYFSFGEKYSDSDIRTINWDYDKLTKLMSEYDYIYIDNADDVFYDSYGDMFDELPENENDRAIYEVADGALKLIWQGDSLR